MNVGGICIRFDTRGTKWLDTWIILRAAVADANCTSLFVNRDGSGPVRDILYRCRKVQESYLDGRSAPPHAFRGHTRM